MLGKPKHHSPALATSGRDKAVRIVIRKPHTYTYTVRARRRGSNSRIESTELLLDRLDGVSTVNNGFRFSFLSRIFSLAQETLENPRFGGGGVHRPSRFRRNFLLKRAG